MNFAAIDGSRGCDWLADWFELNAIVNGVAYFKDYIDALVDRDVPDEDVDSDEVALEQAMDRVSNEIERRRAWLGDAYPFTLESGGLALQLREELSTGRQSYILCLWLSAVIADMISSSPVSVTNMERTLFQFCSTVASASFLDGTAYSFGFARPEGGNILKGLSSLHKHGFPEGQPREELLPWMNASAKDDEVDVIAWRAVNDSMPGVVCLYGQVASGGNWETKSLSSDKIKEFQDSWYDMKPVSRPCLAIFIPVCPWAQILDSEGIDAYRRKMYNKTLGFGIVFSRYRIPYYVDKYLSSSMKLANINAESFSTDLDGWFKEFLARVRGKSNH